MDSCKNNTSGALTWKSGFIWIFFVCMKKLNDRLESCFHFCLHCAGPEHFTPTLREGAFPQVYSQQGVAGAGGGAARGGGLLWARRPLLAPDCCPEREQKEMQNQEDARSLLVLFISVALAALRVSDL